ncbi:MAG TPA: malto-oligosyltrehalose trehalohydrolase [Ohtaekwangia sp.]|nr:malto-oligosyltrehalose trehalohydrolase [Ohtaekwangia sp.]
MEYIYPKVGALHRPDNTTTFTVWAPQKQRVELMIPGHSPEVMQKDAFGYWSLTLRDVGPDTRYTFRIDDKNGFPDPASRSQPEGVHKASAVVDNAFTWDDSNWKGLPLSDMIIYELHVGTFTTAGTFDGVASRLDYLESLGINAIELMPVAQFPGNRNWGYDGVYPYAVQHSYGGVTGLKNLVNESHKRGIAVILDVVYNHQGPEGNYFNEFAPYFTDKYKTFWGSAINFDDAFCDGVRNFYWQNALMWLDEFHIDGLRMDAVHAIWDFSASHFISGLTERVAALKQQTEKEKVLIAEFDLNNPRYINPTSKGGYGMNGQWIDEFHHAVHALVTGEKDGYYEDFGSAKHLAKAIQDCYVYTGEWSVHRKRLFGVMPDNPYSQFVVFAQNHDQVGNRKLGDRLANQLSFEALKLVATTVLLAPQVPMLFMGEEYGEKKPFQYFISHTDEALVEMVRKGRKEEFGYFKWEGEVPDPQGEETFKQCTLRWNMDYDPFNTHLFKFYQFLIQLRKSHPALQSDRRDSVQVYHNERSNVISYIRKNGSSHLLIILNFDDAIASFTPPDVISSGVKIFDSAGLLWNGPGELAATIIHLNEPLLLHPHSAVAFEY